MPSEEPVLWLAIAGAVQTFVAFLVGFYHWLPMPVLGAAVVLVTAVLAILGRQKTWPDSHVQSAIAHAKAAATTKAVKVATRKVKGKK